jgi:hypothetical protein
VELDEDELVELDVEVLEVEVVVPGIVYALIAPSTPTPTTALTTAPMVRRLSRRIAASRARTLAWVVSLVSMGAILAAASESSLRGT